MELILVSRGEAHLHIAPGSCIEVLRFYDKLHPGPKCCFRSPSVRYDKDGSAPVMQTIQQVNPGQSPTISLVPEGETHADMQINKFRANEEVSAQSIYEVPCLRGGDASLTQ